MESSYSSHEYGCSTSQKIPCLLENIKGDYHCKILYIKIWTQYLFYQYTNKVVCVLCWRLQSTEEPFIHSHHKPNKNNRILPSYFFQTLSFTVDKVGKSKHNKTLLRYRESKDRQHVSALFSIRPSSGLTWRTKEESQCYTVHMYMVCCN